ncbi:MAG: hypothetical protein ACQEQA_05465 [Bacillota bacterium]
MNKSKHPILLYVILGLLVVAIAIGPIYSAFSEPSYGPGYDDHPKFTDFSNIDELGQDGTDLVYRFLPDCGACISIKDDVINFAENNEPGLTVYMNHVEYEEDLPPGLDSRVPSLLVVENGSIVDEFNGTNEIPQFFEDVNNGTYEVE